MPVIRQFVVFLKTRHISMKTKISSRASDSYLNRIISTGLSDKRPPLAALIASLRKAIHKDWYGRVHAGNVSCLRDSVSWATKWCKACDSEKKFSFVYTITVLPLSEFQNMSSGFAFDRENGIELKWVTLLTVRTEWS